MVFTPKGKTNIWVIGLLEVLWKVAEAVIDTRNKTVVQNPLSCMGFAQGRGGGRRYRSQTSTGVGKCGPRPSIANNFDQNISYNNIYQRRRLQTLVWYRMGPKLQGLLAAFWDLQEVVTQQNGFHGPQLLATRGTSQGVLAYSTLLYMALDTVVRHWLSLIL